MKKINLIVFILFIIFLEGVGCGRQVDIDYKETEFSTEYSKQVDTSNWKSYDYKDARFSIKYPADWNTSIGMAGELFIILGKGAEQKQLQVSISSENRGVSEIIKTRLQDPGQKKSYVDVIIGGIGATRFEGGDIIVVHNEKIYEFYLTPENDQIINKMLETIKFY